MPSASIRGYLAAQAVSPRTGLRAVTIWWMRWHAISPIQQRTSSTSTLARKHWMQSMSLSKEEWMITCAGQDTWRTKIGSHVNSRAQSILKDRGASGFTYLWSSYWDKSDVRLQIRMKGVYP